MATLFLIPFLGFGRTTLAALKTGQRCFAIEREAKYVDVAPSLGNHDWTSLGRVLLLVSLTPNVVTKSWSRILDTMSNASRAHCIPPNIELTELYSQKLCIVGSTKYRR